MIRSITIFFIVMLCALHIYAQIETKHWLDSALNKLSVAKDDSDKVKLLLAINTSFFSTNKDSAIAYAERAQDLAKRLDWQKGLLNGYIAAGTAYDNKANHIKALDNYLLALDVAQSLHDNEMIANTSMNVGMAYENKSDYLNALDYYFKALKIFEATRDSLSKVPVLNNIGNVYLSLKNYDNALLYYSRSLQLLNGNGVFEIVGNELNNIGDVYNKKGEKDTALVYYQRALAIYNRYPDSGNISRSTINVGYIYQQKKNYTVALNNYFNAYGISERRDYRDIYPIVAMNIGEVYYYIATDQSPGITAPDSILLNGKNKNLHIAVGYLKKAAILLSDQQDYPDLSECTAFLSDAFVATGDYEEALKWHKQSVAYKDSVFNTENLAKISNLETKRQIEIKEKQIEIDKLALAKKRNERIFFIIGICLLLGVMVLIIKNNKLLGKEKRRSEDLLLNILPGEIAAELKEKGSAAARHFDNVTVIFTDFVNFTEAGERMPAQALIDELHTCFKEFDEILGKYKIEKIKTIGDAYLAVGGLPISDPDHAEHVLQAAKEIQKFMTNRKKEIGDATFEIRIGIHSGPVVAGIVGVKKFAYDIWGDTVNTAARMEQSSEPGKINISETTYELVKEKFNCQYRGEIEAKNKGMMRMYYVG